MEGATSEYAMNPILQGECDRLCGLYSILNALVWADPDSYLYRQQLFDSGCRYLVSKKKLAAVFEEGMSTKLWRKLLRTVLYDHQRLMGYGLEQTTLFSELDIEGDGWVRVQKFCASGVPVLLRLKGAYDHFSVVTRVTKGRIELFDSDGQQYLQRRVCRLEAGEPSGRFCVHPDSVIALVKG
ncbi:MAG: hypothetical protein WBG95_08940 [Sulfitobacter sp.]